jgi:hypothetical protein
LILAVQTEKYKFLFVLLNLISKTWRFEIHGDYPSKRGIVAFWHGYMLPVWKFFSQYNPTAIVSKSNDGEILSTILSDWGYNLARGSSSKGGKEALDLIVEKAKSNLILITPDGPRGPYKEFKSGAVVAAMRSQSSLYLCNVEIKQKYIFKRSWDKFEFPLPFTKIILNFSKPIQLSENLNRNEVSAIIDECQKVLKKDKQ